MDSESLYKQLSQQLLLHIEQAGLPAGSRLPSVRTVATQHEVSLMTALKAMRRLEMQGHVEARPRSGYFVAEKKGLVARRRWTDTSQLDLQAKDHLLMVGAPCAVRLDLAVGDRSLYPVDRFGKLMRRLAYQQSDLVGEHVRGTGHPALRQEIARQALQYGCDLNPDELVITNGCIEALNLAIRSVVRPGEVVAVESPSYFVLLQMLKALEVTALPIPCHEETGLDLRTLEAAIAQAPIKAVVTIANANNPMGSVTPDSRKAALVSLLQAHDIPLIEDDIFGDTCFDATRPRPARAFDQKGNVLLCGGYSKSLCPGLRIGWIAAGRFTERVKALKYTTSMATAELPQAAVAGMLASGSYAAHLRQLRGELRHRHRQLRETVLAAFPRGTQLSQPSGGFVLWVQLPEVDGAMVSTRPMFELARAQGIGFAPGYLFGRTGEYENCLRLNAGLAWTSKIEAAVTRLGWLARALRPLEAEGHWCADDERRPLGYR